MSKPNICELLKNADFSTLICDEYNCKMHLTEVYQMDGISPLVFPYEDIKKCYDNNKKTNNTYKKYNGITIHKPRATSHDDIYAPKFK